MVRYCQALEAQAHADLSTSVPPAVLTAVAAELGAATGVSTVAAIGLLERSVALVALPSVLTALAGGQIGMAHVAAFRAATSGVEPGVVADLEACVPEVLATAGSALTPGELRERISVLALQGDPLAEGRRCAAAYAGRRVTLRALPDGMGVLSIVDRIDKAHQAHASLRALARQGWAGHPGFSRQDPTDIGIPARMADAAFELLTGCSAADETAVWGVEKDARRTDERVPGRLTKAEIAAISARASSGHRSTCRPPRTEVTITASLDALRGVSDAPGILSGHVPLPAGLVRQLTGCAPRPGVRFWLAPVTSTGQLLPLPAHEDLVWRPVDRFPSRRLRRYVQTRDRVCRFPGCQVPARACEVDHVRGYASGGQTVRANLIALCRQHHSRAKGVHGWTVTGDAEATLTWTSRGGRLFPAPRPVISPEQLWGLTPAAQLEEWEPAAPESYPPDPEASPP